MNLSRFAPAPGAQALELRTLCADLTRAVGTLASRGIADWTRIDCVAVEFILVLGAWETDPTGLRWVHVLSEYGNVVNMARMAALEYAREQAEDGEGWKIQ